jgi:hypothetical protein
MMRSPASLVALPLVVGLGTLTGARVSRAPDAPAAPAVIQQDTSGKPSSAPLPREKPEMSVFLIGDAGAPVEHEPVLSALQKALSEDARHSIAVFMGDNIYPDGMPDSSSPNRKESERRLQAQLDVVKDSKSAGIFISGNHDWGGISGRDGWNAIRRQGAYIAAHAVGSVMMPEGGCPGPAVRDIGTVLRLVMMDTQWWLRREGPPKNAKQVVPCAFVSQKDVVDSLKKVIKSANGRRVVLMAHHPLASQGQHGGYFTSKNELFPLTSLKSWLRIPLPMVGSVYVAARKLGMSEQDLASSTYSHMIQQVMSAFSENEPLIYASGHDHDIQVLGFGGAPRYALVSGTGIYGHVSGVGGGGPAKFAKALSGFMQLRAWPDGRIHLTVYTVDHDGKAIAAFQEWVAQSGTKGADKPRAE